MLKIQLRRSDFPMAPHHRPWIVRALLDVGSGLLHLVVAASALLLIGGMLWVFVSGPIWLKWLIGTPVVLVALGRIGYEARTGPR
jgi:hypothetical protein